MHLVRFSLVSALAVVGAFISLPLSASNEGKAPVVAAVTDEQAFEAFGYLVGQRMGISAFELTEGEKAAALRGLEAAFSGVEGKFDPEKYGPEIQRVLGGRQQVAMAKAAAKAEVASAGYFEELKKNPKVRSTPSGLHYEIIEAGSANKPTAESTVKVHYTGRLVDGTVFDSSVQRGEPVEFPLGGVIPGWTEGLQLVGVGGKIKLYIPSKLGYGPQGAGGVIPPNATLVFDVELLDVK